jgi:pimeloyl-ACP methyl ester carboxylesterase
MKRLQLAIDAPSIVHSLSLLEPALIGFVPSGPQFGQQLQRVARSLQDGSKHEALDTFLLTVFEGSPQYRQIIDKQLPRDAFDSAVRNLDIIFRLEAPAFQSWKFSVDDAKRITQPILYIGGENSAHYFHEVRELVSSWFPQVKIIMLPGTSHMLHIMNPKPVADSLVDFFSQYPLH